MSLKALQSLQGIIKYSFDPYFLSELIEDFKQFYIQCCMAYDIALIEQIDVYFDYTKYAKEECLFEAIHSLFENCIRHIAQKEQKYSHIVQKALRVIKTGYSNPNISLTNVADQVGISSAYLSSVFKREMKLNMAHYILRLRLEKACLLLEKTQLKVNEVSHAVGYEDKKYFSNIFKQEYGISPKEYRERKWG